MPDDKHSRIPERRDSDERFSLFLKLSLAVMILLMGWAGYNINQGIVQNALVVQRLDFLNEQIKTFVVNQYSASDAARDFALRDQRITNNDVRITKVEDGRK